MYTNRLQRRRFLYMEIVFRGDDFHVQKSSPLESISVPLSDVLSQSLPWQRGGKESRAQLEIVSSGLDF
nr:hypothetical protein CFP56_35905 [Quercus suber]